MFKKYENISQINFVVPIELGIFKHVSGNRIKHDKSTNKRIYTLARGKYSLLLDCSDFSIQLGVILSACRYYIYPCNKLHATTDCKFRTYCSEQSMFVRQLQAEHCLTEGSLRSLSRTVQLISERKSSSERFFEVLFCRYKKVPKSLDCFGGKFRGKYRGKCKGHSVRQPACSSFSCIARETSCLKKLQTDSDWLDLQPSVENDRDWRCVA